ncbi:hypothetical protein GCM10010869_28200 [Mesorhizobium tianshanense]|uniref:Helix-turn-helix protein n=1 Tax=Mesorhizobium tianshanense TaxID=39844 RepID=A0A562MMS1_9HYPH|nr:helix-turn-helix domain-containing protein [Mesorhizobium tianshanense]TWI21217.1 helix-turn-helix protein [Mesorhizobium tianshanense]GLS37227.1 hypothetical protein GCM10010869_28200 [Mesorhizobium tianshanense]
MSDEKLSFTVKEAVRATGLSETTLYRRFKSGALIPRKSEGRTLILRTDLERYLNSLPEAPSGPNRRAA